MADWGWDKKDAISKTFSDIILNESVWIPIKMSLKLVPTSPINDMTALVQIVAWLRLGDKPLFEPMMGSLRAYMRHSASMSIYIYIYTHTHI